MVLNNQGRQNANYSANVNYGRRNNYRSRPPRRDNRPNGPSQGQQNGPFQGHQNNYKQRRDLSTDNRHNSPPQGHNNLNNNHQQVTDPTLRNTAKTIFRFAQLKHHLKNWHTNMPTTIKANIDNTLRNINPPLADDNYRVQLATAGIEFANNLRAITKSFLQRQLDDVINTLKTTKVDVNLSHAGDIASTYAKHMGRMKTADRDYYIRTAVSLIQPQQRPTTSSTNPPRPLDDKRTPHTNTTGTTTTNNLDNPNSNNGTINASTQPTNEGNAWTVVTNRKGKRRHRSEDANHSPSQPPSTIHEQSARTTISPSPAPAPSTKKQKPNNFFTARSGVKVFTGNKEEFTLDGLDINKLIVIGDSNLRNCPSVPPGLEIVSISGGLLRHAVKAVRSYNNTSLDRNLRLAFQIGINHRNDNTPDVDHWFTDLQNAILECNNIKDVFMIGVSHSSSLSTIQLERIAYINESMRDLAGDTNFIPPLPCEEVEILPTDKFGIHFTPSTTKKIIDGVSNLAILPVF